MKIHITILKINYRISIPNFASVRLAKPAPGETMKRNEWWFSKMMLSTLSYSFYPLFLFQPLTKSAV
jgi:hypothetical protein